MLSFAIAPIMLYVYETPCGTCVYTARQLPFFDSARNYNLAANARGARQSRVSFGGEQTSFSRWSSEIRRPHM
jgi:hypothetical protein